MSEQGIPKVVDRAAYPFVRVDRAAYEDEKLSIYDVAVYSALCYFASYQNDKAFPSMAKIAERAKCSERQARKSLRVLEAEGYIKTAIQPKNGANVYFLQRTKHISDKGAAQCAEGAAQCAGGAAQCAGGAAQCAPITRIKELESREQEKDSKTLVRSKGTNARARNNYPPEFEAFWEIYPRRINKVGAHKAWVRKHKAGATNDDILAATRHYAQICAEDRQEERFVMHPSTFLGADDRWREYIEPPKRGHPSYAPAAVKSEAARRQEEEWQRAIAMYGGDEDEGPQ